MGKFILNISKKYNTESLACNRNETVTSEKFGNINFWKQAYWFYLCLLMSGFAITVNVKSKDFLKHLSWREGE